MPPDVNGRRERQGKATLERPRNRHPQTRQAIAVMLRLRLDGLERRRCLYRGSAVEHIPKAGIHGNTPPTGNHGSVVGASGLLNPKCMRRQPSDE